MPTNKETTVFYLKRHLRDLEDKCHLPDMQEMAAKGVSYEARSAAITAAEDRKKGLETEMEAFATAINIIERLSF